MADVIVIAGTVDARRIIKELSDNNIEVAATVTTGFGKELLDEQRGVEVYEGRLTSEGMAELIKDTGVKCLVDVSHPFAREASVNAIAACEKAQVPYLRFERNETVIDDVNVIKAKDFEEAARQLDNFGGNIFLAIGSNNLEIFIQRVRNYTDRLFARVLPDSRVLLKCEKLGLTPNNIIAVKGPFSVEMNIEMLKLSKASVMVTKNSGDAGGTVEKLGAAARLGIPVILVERPEILYGRKFESVEKVIGFVQQLLCGEV